MSTARLVLFMLMVMTPTLAFQNCSKGFTAASVLDKSSSSQCKAAMKSQAQKLKWSKADFRCDAFADYTCERRIFSPDIESMSHSLKECIMDGRICVDVDIRQFNTASAGGGPQANPADFLPGGSYNHEEVNCSHRWLYDGMAVFTGSKPSLEESLSEAMAACEAAQENR